MAKGKAVNVEELIRAALVKLAASDAGAVKLKFKAAADDGLFPDGSGGKPGIERATTGAEPLIRIEKRGAIQFGALTPAGIARASEYLEGDAAGKLLLRMADRVSESERGKFLEDVYLHSGERAASVRASYSAAAERRNRDAFRKQQKTRAEQLLGVIADREAVRGELHGRIALLDTEIGGLTQLLEQLNAAKPPAHQGEQREVRREPIRNLQPTHEDSQGIGLPEPGTQREKDFRKATAVLLAQNRRALPSELQDAKRFFDGVLFNLPGVRRIGKAGEVVPFHPADHQCTPEVPENTPVNVVEPGWLLKDDLGTQVLVPAVVTPAIAHSS
jgi:hypothetical protein